MASRIVLLLGLTACVRLAAAAGGSAEEGLPKGRLQWRKLFNGRDLEGWSVEGKGHWSAEEGCIVGRQDKTAHSESWLFTEEQFSDFVLLVKFRITKGHNSGIFLRIPRVAGHPAHLGYELQIWADDPDYPTGSFYAVAKGTPGLQKEGWNEVQAVCVGKSLFTAVNGQCALGIHNRRRARGRIGFQVHGGVKYQDMEVRFKDLWLAPIREHPPLVDDVIEWKKVKLDSGINEGAAVFDVDQDDYLDVLCGPRWYEGPYWKPHPVRDVKTNGYAESFWELPCDVDRDGYTDIIAGGAFAKKEYWYENPRSKTQTWPAHDYLTRRGFIEDMVILDLDGDGFLNDLLPNGNGERVNWIHVDAGPRPRFEAHEVGKRGRAHGIGYGDVDGDGRIDILTPQGWYKAPPDRTRRWTWRGEFELKGRPGVPIRTAHIDGDRRADIVYGDGHGYGLWWLQQHVDDRQERTWTHHTIDESFSQAHYIALGDINGDGRTDIVAGKRWRAHNGNDPGGYEPTGLFWFEHDGHGRNWTRHTIDFNGGAGCGMGLQVVDLDRDGALDVVAPGKGGLYLFLNQGPTEK
ncbi:MAG: family 16 glycoside hydrolase [Candidatus Brocadiia bacterium]